MQVKRNGNLHVPRARGLPQEVLQIFGGNGECCKAEGSGRLSGGMRRMSLDLEEGHSPLKDKNFVSGNTEMCLKPVCHETEPV